MRLALGFALLLLSLVLFTLPVQAEVPLHDSNGPSVGSFSHSAVPRPTSLAVGILDSMIGALNAIPQYFIRIPGILNGFQPRPNALSSIESDAKLKGDLLAEIDNSGLLDSSIPVNILVYPSFLPAVHSLVEQNEGQDIQSYTYGHIISARVPLSRLRALAQNGSVISIWPDRLFHASLDTSVDQVHAPVMWGAGFTGQGMKIAILDTGVDGSHPMLVGKVVHAVSFTGDSPTDVIGHGTHVAGIAAGKQNGPGTYNGVAPDAQVFNVKVLGNTGTGAESWIIAGINYAIDPDGNASTHDGADIINMSLGGPYTDPSSPVVAAVQSAIASGAIVVVAAGNCGPDCPSSECQGFVGIETPGDAPDAITVGAVDDGSVHACFSSGGIVNGQVKPDVSAPGVGITSSYLNGGMISLSGTSMATPHISGLLALLRQANPSLTPAEVKYILEQSSHDQGSPGKDIQYGSGLVDASGFLPSSVFTLQQYHFSTSPVVANTGAPVSFSLVSDSDTVSMLSVSVTHPNQLIEPIFMSKNGLTWTGSTSNTPEVGTYVVDANVENITGGRVHLQESFVAQTPSTTGGIISYFIPSLVNFGQPVSANIQFQNTGLYDTDVRVELQEWKGDLFQRIQFSAVTPVASGQTVTIPLTWTPDSTIGVKTLKLVATFDDAASEVDQNVEVLDPNPPVIWNVNFPSPVSQWNALPLRARVGDLSPVSGTLHVNGPSSSWDVPLISDPVLDYNQSLHGLIETPEPGGYSFTLAACDSAVPSHCTTSSPYSFTVSACSLPRALVILGDQNADSFSSLQSTYCLGFWSEPTLRPSPSFLSSFPLLYWDAGQSYENAVDENAASWIEGFQGNTVLEGEDIAFRHIDDNLMQGVAHADFNAKYSMDVNSPIHLSIVRPHLILQNIPNPLPFDLNLVRMNPDGVAPDLGTVALASWDANGAGIVASQKGLTKRIFLSFSTRFLPPSVQQTLRANIFYSLFVNSGPDATVDNSIQAFDPSTYAYPDLFQTLGVYPFTQYLTSGPNTIIFSARNIGNASYSNVPFEVSVDGNTQVSVPITANPGQSKRLSASLTLSPGYHSIRVLADPAVTLTEPNSLNNEWIQPVWVAPSLPNVLPVQVAAKYAGSLMTVKARIANYGSTPLSQVPVRTVVDGNVEMFTLDLQPGEAKVIQRVIGMPKKNILVSIVTDPSNIVTEALESDNAWDQNFYFCTKSNILVVNDDDAQPYVDENASSVPALVQGLKENQYCATIWDESTQGVPSPGTLNTYPMVIWSTGDYWAGVLDQNDVAALSQYSGSVLYEGNDIGFDHGDDNLMHVLLHADMNGDLFLTSGMGRIQNLNPVIFPGISSMDVNLSSSSFPDSVTPYNGGLSSGDWNTAKSAIVSYSILGKRTLYSAFAVDMIHSPSIRNDYIDKSVKWLSLAGNQSPTPPTSLTCNGSPCVGNYSGSLSLQCAGSSDPENDPITYSLEANLDNLGSGGTPGWWNASWSYRAPISLHANSDLAPGEVIRLPLDTNQLISAGKMKADCSDLRVVSDATIIQDTNVEGCGSPSSGVFFTIAHSLASGMTDGNGYQLYYGNPLALPNNSAYDHIVCEKIESGNCWRLFDDFSTDTIAQAHWSPTSASPFISNGVLTLHDFGMLRNTKKTPTSQSAIIKLRTCNNSGNEASDVSIRGDTLDSTMAEWDSAYGQARVQLTGASVVTQAQSESICPTFEDWELHLEGNTAKFYINGQLVVQNSTLSSLQSLDQNLFLWIFGGNSGSTNSQYDDVMLRTYPGTNPTLTLGTEEGNAGSGGQESWEPLGTHLTGSSLLWDLNSLPNYPIVQLRCSAQDLNGSGFHSANYQADQNISIN